MLGECNLSFGISFFWVILLPNLISFTCTRMTALSVGFYNEMLNYTLVWNAILVHIEKDICTSNSRKYQYYTFSPWIVSEYGKCCSIVYLVELVFLRPLWYYNLSIRLVSSSFLLCKMYPSVILLN